MKCYICGSEFSDEHTFCPSCGTRYQVDLKKALDNPVERYGGFRTSGFDVPKPAEQHHDPGHAAALLDRGLEMARGGDYREAERVFREAADWDEENAKVLYYWGSCLFKLGRVLEARTLWEKAAGKDPDNPKIQRGLQKVKEFFDQDF